MKPVTQAKFARLMAVDRSYVTRLKQHGRLVMTEHGLVQVEASRQKILDTSGGRDDVAARWARQRGEAMSGAMPPSDRRTAAATDGNKPATSGAGENRTDAQTRKESAAADLLEMEREQKRGNLIPKEDVDATLKAFAASVRAALDVFPDQTAPLVAPVASLDEVHALLAEACRSVLAGVADHLARTELGLKVEVA